MRNLILLAGLYASLAGLPPAYAGAARQNSPVVPCDQPGANPGGTKPSDATSSPCNVGTPNDIGNTAVTQPEAPGAKKRLPPRSQTRQLPPPHNPESHPSAVDR
ncbi:MAG TPA: hypothetical protein VFS17_09285 [Methylophilaceae bacterium]|nr:hypothetical protein [Methylophilaceae bacterium]